MARRKVEGHCRMCGRFDFLTFEHIPPRSAFNDSRVLLSTIDEWMATDLDGRTRGSYQQGGAGGHVLCGPCNNSTGRWYASEYVRWAKSIVPILAQLPANDRPGVLSISGCYPLRLLVPTGACRARPCAARWTSPPPPARAPPSCSAGWGGPCSTTITSPHRRQLHLPILRPAGL